jgi:hypothetical protein
MSSVIINNLSDIEDKTYLELGVFDGKNFSEINAKIKESVDVNGNATFTGTTDEYFDQLPKKIKFDIIFIDANHDYDFVVRDFNNSVKHATEWVLMHDMIPPSKKYTKSSKCSDSFKVLYHLLTKTNFKVYPMNENFGLTLIKMPADKIILTAEDINLTYENFISFITQQKLYSNKEIADMLGEK